MAGLALRAMLAGAIDYAGCFPPASLSLPEAVENYLGYRDGAFAWMLGRFIVRASDADAVPNQLNGALSVVGADHPRAGAVELPSVAQYGKPTYCEVPLQTLHSVRAAGSFAKLRLGGVMPDTIPPSENVLAFVAECRRLELPFKATAGLHHPLRGIHTLTYSDASPTACMHGFLNLLFAACWSWSGGDVCLLPAILDETDRDMFHFDDVASWRGHTLTMDQIQRSRVHFVHSFGSCSLVEPVQELKDLEWL